MVYALGNQTRIGGKKVIGLELLKGDDERLIEVIDGTPDGGLYFGHGRALVSGRRVKTEHMPSQMKAYSKGVIPDYGRWYRLTYVSDRFKAVVEAIEPNVHQFIPFQIVGSKKVVLADMWLMVVCNRLDSVDREHTTLVLDRGRMWMPGRELPREQWPPNFDPNVKGKFVFNLAEIGAHHLWYDKHSIYGPYLSDVLAEALMKADLTGVVLVKQEAV
jgi:hypothetical protein